MGETKRRNDKTSEKSPPTPGRRDDGKKQRSDKRKRRRLKETGGQNDGTKPRSDTKKRRNNETTTRFDFVLNAPDGLSHGIFQEKDRTAPRG